MERGRDRQATAPGFAAVGLNTATRRLDFIQADGEVAQRCQGMRRGALRDAAGILAETDVAAMVDAILDRRPMITDDTEQFVVG